MKILLIIPNILVIIRVNCFYVVRLFTEEKFHNGSINIPIPMLKIQTRKKLS